MNGAMMESTLRLLTGQGKEVLVVLPPNGDAFLTEMRAYLKIEHVIVLPKIFFYKNKRPITGKSRNS